MEKTWAELESIGNPLDRLQEWCDRRRIDSVTIRWNSAYHCDIKTADGRVYGSYASNLRDAVEQTVLNIETAARARADLVVGTEAMFRGDH